MKARIWFDGELWNLKLPNGGHGKQKTFELIIRDWKDVCFKLRKR